MNAKLESAVKAAVLVLALAAVPARAQVQEGAARAADGAAHVGGAAASSFLDSLGRAQEGVGKGQDEVREAAGTAVRHKVVARREAPQPARGDAPEVNVGPQGMQTLLAALEGKQAVTVERGGVVGEISFMDRVGLHVSLDQITRTPAGTSVFMKILELQPDGKGIAGMGVALYDASCGDYSDCRPKSLKMSKLTKKQADGLAADVLAFWSEERPR